MIILIKKRHNLINKQPDIDKIYSHAKDPYETKYQYLINKYGKKGLNHYDNTKDFIEYSNSMPDVYKNIEEHNPYLPSLHNHILKYQKMLE